MVEDVVAVVSTITLDANVTTQDGDVDRPVAIFPGNVAYGRVEAAAEGHPILQLEGRRTRFARIEFHGGRVGPRRHPNLVPYYGPVQGRLQGGEGILPGGAVVRTHRIGINIDRAVRRQ